MRKIYIYLLLHKNRRLLHTSEWKGCYGENIFITLYTTSDIHPQLARKNNGSYIVRRKVGYTTHSDKNHSPCNTRLAISFSDSRAR